VSSVIVTRFGAAAASEKEELSFTLEGLVDIVLRQRGPSKGDLPWLKLARFGDIRSDKNSLRYDNNVLALTGIEADYDGERLSFDFAVDTLARGDLCGIVYTSPSHTTSAPRWRVLCPISSQIERGAEGFIALREARNKLLGRLNGLFGGVFAGESWTLSQGYFYGAVGDGTQHRVQLIEGRPIDLRDDLDITALGKAAGAAQALTKAPITLGDNPPILVENLSEWLRELIVEGKSEGRKVKQRGPQCFNAVRNLHRAGYTQAQVEDLAARYPAGVFGKYEGRIAAEVRRVWEKLDAPTLSKLPIIRIDPGKHDENARAGLQACRDVAFYQRGGQLVKVNPVKRRAWDGVAVVLPAVAEVGKSILLGAMSDSAYWVKEDSNGDSYRVPAPETIVEMSLKLPDAWPFPILRGVIGTPTLRPDGSLLTAPGYDPPTGFVLYQPPKMPPIPEYPTRTEAETALALLDGLLSEFPFVFRKEASEKRAAETLENNASRSAALCGFMTTVLRTAIDLAPLHAFSAPAPGTGKSYLVDMFSMLAYGDRTAVLSQSVREEETEKRLIGAALSGQPIIALDNCSGPLTGDFLCQVTERPVLQLRPLGTSDQTKVDNTFTTFANGNNIEVAADQVRRTIICWMDAECEAPEDRIFKRSPLEEIRRNRGAYIAAVLTITRAYICAGSPEKRGHASYDTWSYLVRSPLLWLGRCDPIDTTLEVRLNDPERTKRAAVFSAWPDDENGYSTGDIIDRSNSSAELRYALLAVAVGKDGAISPERLGKWLSKQQKVIVGGLRLSQQKNERGKITWHLVRLGAASPRRPQPEQPTLSNFLGPEEVPF
jgi:putative DNA primase/helicase